MVTPLEGSLKGHLLMAMPGLADPNFAKSVTLICEHSASGAMGVTINRVSASLVAGDIFKELGIAHQSAVGQVPIYYGGPVHVDEIFIVHGEPFSWEGCLMVTATVALSNTLDLLTAIAEGNGPESYMIFLGCAGWGQGQLEAEMLQNAWVTCQADWSVLFEVPPEQRWDAALNRMGINPDLLSDFAGNA